MSDDDRRSCGQPEGTVMVLAVIMIVAALFVLWLMFSDAAREGRDRLDHEIKSSVRDVTRGDLINGEG